MLDEDLGSTTGQDRGGKPLDVFPMAVTADVLERGQERFNVYCAPCHDRTAAATAWSCGAASAPPPSLARGPAAPGAGRLFLRRDDQRLRRDAGLRVAGGGCGSLGDRRLHPRVATAASRRRSPTRRRRKRRNCKAPHEREPATMTTAETAAAADFTRPQTVALAVGGADSRSLPSGGWRTRSSSIAPTCSVTSFGSASRSARCRSTCCSI